MTWFLTCFDVSLCIALMVLAFALCRAGLRGRAEPGTGGLVPLAVLLVVVAARLVAP